MGVYIKGMDMPTKGEYSCTLYVCSDGSAYIEVWSFPEGNDKFLVASIPPHGRLIDADAFEKYCDQKWIPLNVDALHGAPTVIEAED